MPERLSYVIVGSGIAGATAAEVIRSEDAAAEITIIANDPFPVYYRPALKDYLGGKVREDKLWARPVNYYQDRGIRFLADTVVGVQQDEHCVQLQSGRKVGYTRLLLANGARASSLTCPGIQLSGVTALRTVADYQVVLSRLDTVRRIVVTGSGTLALETIETLRHRGFQVTHLLRRRALWSDVLDPIASDLVLQEEKRGGVDVRFEQEIAEILGVNGQVTGVVTTTGERIACEMVIMAIGIDPLIDFLKASGITCGRGVKVDSAMQTSAPDVYAAGDIIETSNPLTGRARVIGQWYPSIQQARAAAYSMLDLLDTQHQFLSNNFYNATFLYGLDFASVGLTNIPNGGGGYQEIVADPLPRTYQKVVLKDGMAVGALALGERKSILALKRAIDHRVNLSAVASRLFVPDFRLADWLDSQGIPGPMLGIQREGAIAVRSTAYADSRSRSALIPAQPTVEAALIATAPDDVVASIGTTRLSRTKVTTIGRQEGIALSIPHASISRRHAEISYANDHYILRDLGSRNGTGINNKRIEAGSTHVLKSGDLLRFGQVTFAFQAQPATVQQKPSQPALRAASEVVSHAQHDNTLQEPPTVRSNTHEALQLASVSQGQVPGISHTAHPPELAADGSLALPHGGMLPPEVVATLRTAPALVVVGRGKPEEVYLLQSSKQTTIGRERGNTIVLNDAAISRKHAQVYADSDGFYIRDLGSSNGVLLNQVRIGSPNRLSHGDRIVIGGLMLYFISLQAESEKRGQKVCANCGAASEQSARFCPKCGTAL